jgi:hypothetical protein
MTTFPRLLNLLFLRTFLLFRRVYAILLIKFSFLNLVLINEQTYQDFIKNVSVDKAIIHQLQIFPMKNNRHKIVSYFSVAIK